MASQLKSKCRSCGQEFFYTGKPCNSCKKLIGYECLNCHNQNHNYKVSEHGFVNYRYAKILTNLSLCLLYTTIPLMLLIEVR